MRAALQRWLWLAAVLPAGAMFAAEAEHGLPQGAVKLDHWGGFITNSMVVCWLVAIGLIVFSRVATRDMQGVPGAAQNLMEWLVEPGSYWQPKQNFQSAGFGGRPQCVENRSRIRPDERAARRAPARGPGRPRYDRIFPR